MIMAATDITMGHIAGWIAGVSGLIAWLIALYKIGPERKKIIAEVERAGVDSAKVLSETAVSLLQPSIDQITFLHTQLEAARKESKAAREESAMLREEISQLRDEISSLRRSRGRGEMDDI